MSRLIFLQTYGYQMNERDSEEILGMLTAQGYGLRRRARRLPAPRLGISEAARQAGLPAPRVSRRGA